MKSFFLVLLLVLSAIVGFAPSAATSKTNNSSSSIAKPNCSDRCGNVMIPFPFGLREECALNSNFSITCNTSYHPPKPFITNTTAEVKDITVKGQLSVMKPINKICYNQTGGEVSSFESWPTPPTFYLNQTANKFITVGCDALALLIDYELQNQIEACRAFCDGLQEVKNGSCETGIGCCETGTTNVARNAFVEVGSLQKYTNTTHVVIPCSYAFVVQKEEFIFSSTMLTREWGVEKLPVVLDWIISNQTCNTACQGNTTCVVAINDTASSEGYRCACKEGYEGNPYLSGCQDIDECEDGEKNNCSQNAICSNTKGSYECSCNKGYHGDGKGALGCISSSHQPVMLVLGIALGTITLLIFGFCLYLAYLRRKSIQMKDKFFMENGGLILEQKIAQGSASSCTTRIFTADELKRATNNYDQIRIIGQGGFGIVYRGHLFDGQIVAIKKAKMMDPTQVEQFINEVIVLSQINHRNIVKLFGCCLETEIPLLVYEFINNGTLSEHLHSKNKASKMSWPIRLRIATETAEVLSYLHTAASPPIIHRDIKSANILLDDYYTAKVSDFGASRLVPQDQTQLTTMVKGTFGYLDPEYLQTNHLTEKSDVYSFGVVLVELLTSRSPLSFYGPEKERHLSQYFLSLLKGNQLFKILDDNIVCEGNTKELQEVALLAKRCLNVKADDRPTMKDVAIELGGLRRAAKHQLTNNSETSLESQTLHTKQPMPIGYDATFSTTTTTEYDSLKHHIKLPVTAGR
ncbi:putative wall-associated receptor kinase-like 16 [Ipomoea triloba]|uniref:putative wall-associated receptor kinase-like 16 n=1 Tax=Ipomoea triloba TaxID=35885 RepID=UPI00125DE473|nr:putative wall-associated receptor kinase-like 16 [Ipomoea triloba]